MATAKKSAGKKTSGRKYGALASESVEREMKAMKEGTLKSGSGEKVTNPRQAIAIGLSEARRAGGKVPAVPAKKAAVKKAAVKKAVAKKTSAKKTVKKAPAKKTAAKKAGAAAKR